MSVTGNPANLGAYRAPQVVSYYSTLDYLTACERFLFDAHLKPGMAILDLGVGGGRTTPYLAKTASRYVGADYSEEMISACRTKFPGLEFRVADASDLSAFSDASFDAIVMAYNALDYVLPAEKRERCLRECRRLLRPDGLLVFSSHNPRAVLVRPAWDPARLRAFAGRVISQQSSVFPLAVAGLTVAKALHASARAAAGSAARLARRLPRTFFWKGEGCCWDPTDGGLMTHYWTPKLAMRDLSRSGFQLRASAPNDYPRPSRALVTDWYYYVFSVAGLPEGR
jgi:SAM-dependent methyltransferase